jgi:Ring finger domain
MPRPPSSSLRDLGGGGSESSGGCRDLGPASSSLRFSMLGISGSLRNLGARNTSLGPADEEIRIPTPGSRLLGGLEETALSAPLESAPMRWAAGSCTICLASYQVGDSVTWSSNPKCEHCFHTSCIEEWVLRRRPQTNNDRRRRASGTNNHDEVGHDHDDDGSAPRCPNCRRPFVVVGLLEGGDRDARAGFPAVLRSLIDDGGGDNANAANPANAAAAAAAAACAVDPFAGAGGTAAPS